MTLAELAVKISVDEKELKSALASTQKQTKDTVTGLSKLGPAIAAAFSVGAVVAFGKSLVAAASAAEETQQKFNVVFSGISASAEEMAVNFARSFGTSEQASKDMLASTGNLLQAMGFTTQSSLEMSVELAKLGADITSFSNFQGGAEEATRILTKAMLGERDALQALDLKISEAQLEAYAKSIGKTTAQLTQQEKATWTLNEVTRQAANAIGDFERSSTSFANSTRTLSASWDNFSAQLGNNLLPALASVERGFASILDFLTQNQKEVDAAWAKMELRSVEGAKNIRSLVTTIYGTNPAIVATMDKLEAYAQKRVKDAEKKLTPTPAAKKSGGSPLSGGAGKKEIEEEVVAYEQGLSVFEQIRRSAFEMNNAINKNKTATEQWAESLKKVEFATNGINQLLSAGAQLAAAITQKKIQDNDLEMQKELEKRGLLEADATTKAEQELAKAKASGDAERTRLAQLALDKAKIEEKFAKKKRQLEYEGALVAWQFQLAQATATLPLMVMNAWNSGMLAGGLPFAIISASIASAAGAMQLAAVAIAKPAKPKFEAGGIVPGDSYYGDKVAAQLNSGEMVLNQRQQAQLFQQANGGSNGMMRVAPIPKETLFDVIFRASQNGELFIAERAVTAR